MSTRASIKRTSQNNAKASMRAAEKINRRVSTSTGVGKFVFMIIKVITLAFFGFIVLFPFYFMISASLMSFDDLQEGGNLVPDVPQFGNYTAAFLGGYFAAFFFSSAVIVVNIVLKLLVCMLLGYAFANYKFKGKNFLWGLFMLTMMVPEVALISGQFKVVTQTGMREGLLLLVAISAPFIASIFTAYMFRTSFENIPSSVKEAAMVDGITGTRYFFKIAVPMVSTTIWTVVILTVFASWNSYMWPNLLLISSDIDTIPLWLFNVGAGEDGQPPQVQIQMAGTVLATIPTMVIYFLFRNKIHNVVAGGSANKG